MSNVSDSSLLSTAPPTNNETVLNVCREKFAIDNPSPGLMDDVLRNLYSDTVRTPMKPEHDESSSAVMTSLPPTDSSTHLSILKKGRNAARPYFVCKLRQRQQNKNARSAKSPDDDFRTGVGRGDGKKAVPEEEYSIVSEQHIPGFNDYMSGGISISEPSNILPERDWLHPNGSNDATVCVDDFNTALANMPFYMLTGRELRSMGLFRDCHYNSRLADDTVTTIWGLHRAVDQYLHGQGETDEQMYGAILLRCGYLPVDKMVAYPEDIAPLIAREFEAFDHVYWAELKRQGDIWNEIDLGDGYPDNGSVFSSEASAENFVR